MEILFNYRPDGRKITTKNGDKEIIVIRKGPRGIVAKLKDTPILIIWGSDDADAHIGDSEEVLVQKIIDILDA